MQTQNEAKFIDVDHEDIKKRLTAIMAKLVTPKRLMRSAVLDYPDHELNRQHNGLVRLRDEGDSIKLTYKEVTEQQAGGIKQIDLAISSFEDGVELFEKLDLKVLSLQESKRETWQVENVYVRLEEWPWVNTYIEIEGPSEAKIRDVAARLGFKWSQAIFGSPTLVYAAEYPGIRLDRRETINLISEIKFGDPVPQWLKERSQV
jgi:adenylate cyclase class 2